MSNQNHIIVSKEIAMRLYDSYKKNGNITTHQPYPLGAGGVAKFWTKNLSFINTGSDFQITVKKNGNQSALTELAKFLGTEVSS